MITRLIVAAVIAVAMATAVIPIHNRLEVIAAQSEIDPAVFAEE